MPIGMHAPKSPTRFMFKFIDLYVLKSNIIRFVLVFWFTSQDRIALMLDDDNNGGPAIVSSVNSSVPFASATVGTPRVPRATLRV